MRHHGDHGPRLHLAAEQRGRNRAWPVQVYQGLARTAVNNIFRAYFYLPNTRYITDAPGPCKLQELSARPPGVGGAARGARVAARGRAAVAVHVSAARRVAVSAARHVSTRASVLAAHLGAAVLQRAPPRHNLRRAARLPVSRNLEK